MQYIAQVYGGSTGLYPATPTEQALARQWLEFGEQYLVAKTNPVFFGQVRGRYAASLHKEGTPPRSEIEAAVPGCVEAFEALERHLVGRRWVLGEEFTVADITVAIQANRLIVRLNLETKSPLQPRTFLRFLCRV